MADTVFLSWQKDNPTIGVDDAINLNDISTYTLRNLQPGKVSIHPLSGWQVQEVQMVIDVTSQVSLDACHAAARTLDGYLTRTRKYMRRTDYAPAARSDGCWNAAVLTIKAESATNPVFWDVVEGHAEWPKTYLTPSQAGSKRMTMMVNLLVRAPGRGARVKLQNLVRTAAFESPFNPAVAGLTSGYTFPNTVDYTVSQTYAYYGSNSLRWAASSSTTLTTNENQDFNTGDVILPAFSVRGNITGGTMTAKLQIYNGSTWSDQQTIKTLTSADNTALGSWQVYTGTAYTVAAGITKVRLSFTSPTSGTLYYGYFAEWRNPVGNARPTEFMSYGGSMAQPQLCLYNIQGDNDSPLKLRVDNWGGALYRAYFIGGEFQDLARETPLQGMDLKVGNVFYKDSVTRTDTSGTLTNSDTGHTYSLSAASNFSISSGKIIQTGATVGAMFYTDIGSADGTYSIDLVADLTLAGTTEWYAESVFRMIDTSNFLMSRMESTTQTTLWKCDTGVFTQLASAAASVASGATHTITVITSGNSITTQVNGVNKITWTLTAGDTKYAGATTAIFYGGRATKAGSPTVTASWSNLSFYGPATSSDTTFPWASLPPTGYISGAFTGTNAIAFSLDSNYAKTVDLQKRSRHALLIYGASKSTTGGDSPASSVSVTIGGQQWLFSDYYNPGGVGARMMSTQVASTALTSTSYFRVLDLGRLDWPGPEVHWSDKTIALNNTNTWVSYNLTSMSMGSYLGCGGLILLPDEQFAFVDMGNRYGADAIELYADEVAISAGHYTSYTSTGAPVGILGNMSGSDVVSAGVYITPCLTNQQVNRFEIIPVSTKDNQSVQQWNGYWYFGVLEMSCAVEYTPLYDMVA